MRITTYRTELDENRHNILVKEEAHNYPADFLDSPQNTVAMMNRIFRLDKLAEEYVYLIAMDVKSKPLGIFQISHGTVNTSICNPRDIFVKALLCGATYCILVHNHPSGIPAPSKEDVAVYQRLKEAGSIIGVDLVDSIIVGDTYYSFLKNQYGEF